MTDDSYFLKQYLEPLESWLQDEHVSEIICNRPGVVWVERLGHLGLERHAVPQLTPDYLVRFARLIAGSTSQGVNREHPLLSATLPTGERIQFVMPPISASGVFAIRKQALRDLSLQDFEDLGAFAATQVSCEDASGGRGEVLDLLRAGSIREALSRAVLERKNILISGATSTAKTTLLNALAKQIPDHEHLVTIEDAAELRIAQPVHTAFVASRGDQGEAAVDMQDLLDSSLRLRPDRILLGEIRGKEAWTFLECLGSGHSGSFSTVHAGSPALAFQRLALIVMRAGLGLERPHILEYLRQVVDLVVQLRRTREGQRVVTEVHLVRA